MNATYDVFSATDEEFALIFPNDTDVEFIEDFLARVDKATATRVLEPLWTRRADKKTISGIHGTLFYGLEYKKKLLSEQKGQRLTIVF